LSHWRAVQDNLSHNPSAVLRVLGLFSIVSLFGWQIAAIRSIMVGSPPGKIGFQLLDPPVRGPFLDQRAETRFLCRGQVQLILPDAGGEMCGELVDISAHGFRVSLTQAAPENGTELEFSHQFFHGRARLMWTLQVEGRYEAGFMVLRD
jgi:hypothetical protein